MCNWSGKVDAASDAQEGEQLVTSQIEDHIVGLKKKCDGEVVCVLPRSILRIVDMPVIVGRPDVPVGTSVARLEEHTYAGGEDGPTDKLVFDNGAEIFLTYVPVGVNVTVLKVPAIVAAEPVRVDAVERERELEDLDA